LCAGTLAVLCACTTPSADADGARQAATQLAANQLAATIASPQRNEANRARDASRHPYETLRAFGLRADQTVIEIAPGGGWYTEILAPYLRERGHYIAALYVDDAATPAETDAQLAKARERFDAKFTRLPDRYGRITVGSLRARGLADVGPPGSADAVLTFRNIHN